MTSTPARDPTCRICGAGHLRAFDAREMMFGLRERFCYLECPGCGCVQIAAYLDDAGRYYPPGYYAHVRQANAGSASPLKRLARAAKMAVTNASPALRQRFLDADSTRTFLATRPLPALYLKHVPDPAANILDVGCGDGALLRELATLYYSNLHGVDPFIARDVVCDGRVLVRKAELRDMAPGFDCISFHHVLEHMPDQCGVLTTARRLLAFGGILMIRIPVVGGAAWRDYRENWVQLDPPRHYYLHSEQSFRLLAAQAGLEVTHLHHDSTGFQFWGPNSICATSR